MTIADALSGLLAVLVLALVARRLLAGGRREPMPNEVVLRREWLAWEVRGLVVAVSGPCAAGVALDYLPRDYLLPLLLFVAAGFLTAGLIAPPNRHAGG